MTSTASTCSPSMLTWSCVGMGVGGWGVYAQTGCSRSEVFDWTGGMRCSKRKKVWTTRVTPSKHLNASGQHLWISS